MQTKYISVRIVAGDTPNLCGKGACRYFTVRSNTGGYRASCRLFGSSLGGVERGQIDVEGTILRCDECLRAREL